MRAAEGPRPPAFVYHLLQLGSQAALLAESVWSHQNLTLQFDKTLVQIPALPPIRWQLTTLRLLSSFVKRSCCATS